MKLLLNLLATASYGAPERKKQKKPTNDRSAWSTPPVPCSTAISNSHYMDQSFLYGGSPFKSIDNGQSGQVTINSYAENANCYVDIGPSCDANGVQVQIIHMELEVVFSFNYDLQDYEYTGCYDTIHFEWVNKYGHYQTNAQCECLGESHTSCDESDQYYFNGTGVKLVLRSNNAVQGGKIQVDWNCYNL